MAPTTWTIRDRTLSTGARTLVMGVLNVTPDSFSDGGLYLETAAAVARARRMIEEGADLLDVGGESTRPGATAVTEEEQIRRVVPVIRELAGDVPLGVDTRSATVARAAIEAGATIVNDVSGLTHDPAMASACADLGCGVVLMHMRGTPETMRSRVAYDDVVADVVTDLSDALSRAGEAGIPEDRCCIDPGIGFAKTGAQSYRLVGRLATLGQLGRPILLGVSRKSFLGEVLEVPPSERLMGTAAAVTAGILAGAAIVRVHDVAPMVQVARVADAIRIGKGGDS